MRQTGCTKDDMRMIRALENMRFCACDARDFAWLRSRLAVSPLSKVDITSESYRNASIITAHNIIKDGINDLGVRRYAQETGQELEYFYAEDRLRVGQDCVSTPIPAHIQELLWKQPPTFCDLRIAGRLAVCRGMPVMIRTNAATELSMTKGQEGFVYGWDAREIGSGRRVLNTLFVKLDNPPTSVQFPGLPLNVVPMVRTTNSVKCDMPHLNSKLKISRSQVEVLPNFAMTDYASQGKSRDINVVDLQDCRNHHAYYVALSRGRTSDGTAIIRKFEEGKITGGCSGALRQEYRELELLDDITKLRYEGRLPNHINAHRRLDIIAQYRKWRGAEYMPATVAAAIRWRDGKPEFDSKGQWSNLDVWCSSTSPSIDWQNLTVNAENKGNLPKEHIHRAFVPLQEIRKDGKRRAIEYDNAKRKRVRMESPENLAESAPEPLLTHGPCWTDNSCAYDAVVAILAWMVAEDEHMWMPMLENWEDAPIRSIAHDVKNSIRGDATLCIARDKLRLLLERIDHEKFRYNRLTSVVEVIRAATTVSTPVIRRQTFCKSDIQHHIPIGHRNRDYSSLFIEDPMYEEDVLSKWFSGMPCASLRDCSTCGRRLQQRAKLLLRAPFLVFDVQPDHHEIRPRFSAMLMNGRCEYVLRGVIYYHALHFTARVTSPTGEVFKYDGMKDNGQFIYEATYENIADWRTLDGRFATIAFYALNV